MTDSAAARGPSASQRAIAAAAGAGLLVFAASGVLATFDVAGAGAELSAAESLATAVLWLLGGALVGLALGAAVAASALLVRGWDPERIALLAALAGLELAVLLLLDARWLGPATAAVLGGLVLWLALRGSRTQAWSASVRWPCLAAAALALAASAFLGSGVLAASGARLALAWCVLLIAIALQILPGTFASHLVRLGAGLALLVLGALGLAGICCAPGSAAEDDAAPPAPPERPNVVLIVLDTLRADHLGIYGGIAPDWVPAGLSPELDRFASQGAVFESCFAPAPWTVPSHASLFTGLYPASHGASTEHHRWLDASFTTLAERLGAAGYETAAFSANRYLDESNLLQGFEERRSLGGRFDRLGIRPLAQALGWPAKWADHGAQDAVESLERFLAQRAHGREGGAQPLFLFVNLLEPHWRYLPPIEGRGDFLPEGIGIVAATRLAARIYGPLLMAGQPLDGPVETVARAMYAAAVRYQDARLGEILASLDRHLGRERTLVVVTSDHGENLGEGGRWDHVFSLDDRLIHVPLAIRGEAFPPGARVAGLCSLVDVPVTIAELALGAELAPGLAGRSLVPGRFRPRAQVFAQGDPYYGHLARMEAFTGFERDVGAFARALIAVRSERAKLVLSAVPAPDRFELVLRDLARDPDETQDALAAEPEVAEELVRALAAWRAELRPYQAESSGSLPLSSDTLERLMRTGYVGGKD